MTIEMATLLLELVSRGVDTGLKMQMAYEHIIGLDPAQVREAIGNEEAQTKILMEIARNL